MTLLHCKMLWFNVKYGPKSDGNAFVRPITQINNHLCCSDSEDFVENVLVYIFLVVSLFVIPCVCVCICEWIFLYASVSVFVFLSVCIHWLGIFLYSQVESIESLQCALCVYWCHIKYRSNYKCVWTRMCQMCVICQCVHAFVSIWTISRTPIQLWSSECVRVCVCMHVCVSWGEWTCTENGKGQKGRLYTVAHWLPHASMRTKEIELCIAAAAASAGACCCVFPLFSPFSVNMCMYTFKQNHTHTHMDLIFNVLRAVRTKTMQYVVLFVVYFVPFNSIVFAWFVCMRIYLWACLLVLFLYTLPCTALVLCCPFFNAFKCVHVSV